MSLVNAPPLIGLYLSPFPHIYHPLKFIEQPLPTLTCIPSKYLNSISSDNIPNLKNKFIANNLDYQLFLNEIEIQFKWQKLIYQIYSNKIEINDNNLDDEINDLIKNNTNIKEYNVSEIEILFENNNSDKSRIMNIQNEIKYQMLDD